jgi:hypothetical protein
MENSTLHPPAFLALLLAPVSVFVEEPLTSDDIVLCARDLESGNERVNANINCPAR